MPFTSQYLLPLPPSNNHYSDFYCKGLIMPVLELSVSIMTSVIHHYVYDTILIAVCSSYSFFLLISGIPLNELDCYFSIYGHLNYF